MNHRSSEHRPTKAAARHVWKNLIAALTALPQSRRGAIGVALALMAVPIIMLVGAAVDYARLEQFKTQLQATVDSAALSGAAAYVDSTQNTNATTVAQNYLTANVTYLPSHVGTVTTSTSAAQVTTGSNQGYTVTANATATIGTTFMRILTSTLKVSATATAVNPLVTITMSAGNFKSSAADGNSLWYWLIPAATPNAVPTTSKFATSQFLASNVSGSNTKTVTFVATATQKVGVALENVTGEISDYGCNQYQTAPESQRYVKNKYGGGSYQEVQGTCQNTTQWFFSNIMPPAGTSYAISSIDTGYQKQPKNCSLETTITSQAPTVLTAPISGQCFTTLPTDSYPSCSALNGQYVNLYWNDMGGSTDDYDYNDAEISLSCSGVSGSGNSATNVYLSK
jgi:Flp pilus assembly protein TadG